MAGAGAFGVDEVDESFEGQVLVGVGAEVGFPHPGQEFAEGGVTGEVGAQDEGVDEQPDEVVDGVVAASGDRVADGNVLAGAGTGQQQGQRGLEAHEDSGTGLAGEFLSLGMSLDGEAELQSPPVREARAVPAGPSAARFRRELRRVAWSSSRPGGR